MLPKLELFWLLRSVPRQNLNNLNLLKMTKDQALGMLRHLLTFGAGLLIAKGKIDNETANTIVGGIIAAAGAGWSFHKNKSNE